MPINDFRFYMRKIKGSLTHKHLETTDQRNSNEDT